MDTCHLGESLALNWAPHTLLLLNVLSLLNVLPLVLGAGCRRVEQCPVLYTGMYFVSSFVRLLCDCDTPVCGVLCGMKCLYGTPIPPPPPHTHICTCYTGPDPTVGTFLAGGRQTILGIPPTSDQLQHLSQLVEQGRQQGGGGAEGGPDVNGSASGLGATPNMIV